VTDEFDRSGVLPPAWVDVRHLPCDVCGEAISAHDRDDIGAGLFQFACPEKP